MADQKIIIVTGLARCGTSLVMQILHAAGVPIYGPDEARYPAFEHPATMLHINPDTSWMPDARGKAIKVLDPHVNALPAGHAYRVIWLDRDPEQQAKSFVKFLSTMVPLSGPARDQRRAFEASLRRDRAPALAAIRRVTNEILPLRFEGILAVPDSAAATIANFLGLDNAVIPQMARQVVKRSAKCYPGLLELELMRRAA